MQNQETNRIIKEKEAINLIGLSKTTIWRLQKLGKFPASIKLSSRAKGYILADILAWLEDKKAGVQNGL